MGELKDTVTRSWFAVFNNPKEHGYDGTPLEVIERLRDEWVSPEHPERTGAWMYCISADGLHHVHMVLEDTKPMRFSVIKKSYAVGMHFEATKGMKEQVEDYLLKRGKFEEKGEKIIETVQVGELKGRKSGTANESTLDKIDSFLAVGMKPAEILAMGIRYYTYETIIRKAYIDRRVAEMPQDRKIMVYWHTGKSGAGKSYSCRKLRETKGADEVFLASDYANYGTSLFDGYSGERVVFMDEFKGDIPYGLLLNILSELKHPIHCRYFNTYNIWEEVHITSVYTPFGIYQTMVEEDRQDKDPYSQLKRRINYIVYHYCIMGSYGEITFPIEEFHSIEEAEEQAQKEYLEKSWGCEVTLVKKTKGR